MSLFTPTPSSLTSLSTSPKTILITGSSSGIGLSTATLLSTLHPSHNLILLDLHPPPTSFPHSPTHTLFVRCDITSWHAQRAAFASGIAHFGRVDCVFANAGIAEHGEQFFNDERDAEGELAAPDRRVVRVDLDAAADTVKLAIHYLRRNRGQGGGIVLTASLAGYLASAGAPVYSAAKHGESAFVCGEREGACGGEKLMYVDRYSGLDARTQAGMPQTQHCYLCRRACYYRHAYSNKQQ